MDTYVILLLLHMTLILILMNQTSEAVILPKAMRLQGTSKQWNKYILKAIVTVLSAELRNNHSTKVALMSNLLERGHRKLDAMMNVSRSRYTGNYFPSVEPMKKPLGEFQKSMTFTTKPLGPVEEQIFFRNPGFPLYLSYTFIWFFFLDLRLELNLTIHHTYFTSVLSSKCLFGNLTLRPFFHGNGSKFVFCGQHPTISNYLRSNMIDVILAVERFVAFDLVISYSVIDSGPLTSVALNLDNHKFQPLSMTLILPVNKIFYCFYMSTEKFNRLYLPHDNQIFKYALVYEGPGYHRDPLQPAAFRNNISWYLSNTFQCTVHLYLFESDITHLFNLRYFSEPIGNISKLYLNKTQTKWLNFSNENCLAKNQVCAIEITANNNSKVNLTVNHLIYHGQVHSTCNYGGLTTYDKVNGTYIEHSTICTPHNGVFKQGNIFSKTSVLLLVFYLYEGHAHVEIDSIVSSTACMPISFNTFVVHKLCLWDKDSQCNTYLKRLRKNQALTLYFNV